MMPWWMKSPSPFTVAQWIVLTLVGVTFLFSRGYRAPTIRHKLYVMSCVACTLGFIVLSSDAVWSLFSVARWGSLHPDSVPHMWIVIARDVVGSLFCLSLMNPLIHNNYVRWRLATTLLWIGNFVFFILWFSLAQSPAQTDWTYAFRYGHSWRVIWTTFAVSHVLGRVITSGIYLSLFNRQK